MKLLAVAICLLGTAARAEITCTMQNTACTQDCAQMQVRFTIDPSQFVNPQDASDPPRRQIAAVNMDGAIFNAEAILFQSGVRGFHEDAGEIGSRLMIVQPDGTARLVLQPVNEIWVGHCDG